MVLHVGVWFGFYFGVTSFRRRNECIGLKIEARSVCISSSISRNGILYLKIEQQEIRKLSSTTIESERKKVNE